MNQRSACKLPWRWALTLAAGTLPAVFASETLAQGTLAAEVRASLPPTEQHLGVGVRFEKGAVTLVSCAESCEPEGVRITLSEEISQLKPKVEQISLEDSTLEDSRRALLVRYPGKNKSYVILALGPARGPGARPELALKGWVGPDSESHSELVVQGGKDEKEVLLVAGERSVACGRSAPESVKRLSAGTGRFRAVRQPVLSEKDRRDAERKELVAEEKVAGELLVADGVTEPSASAPVDSDRTAVWNSGHDYVTFELTETDVEGFVLEVAEPLAEEKQLYLLGKGRALELILKPGAGALYPLSLPEDFPRDCLTFVQPRVPAPVTEIMRLLPEEKTRSPRALAAALDTERADFAVRALSVSAGAEVVLAELYGRMNGAQRSGARAVAERMGARGLPITVAALEFGSEAERTAAVGTLLAFEAQAVPALKARLKKAGPLGAAHLAKVLAALSPQDAATELPPLLARPEPELRSILRGLISELGPEMLPVLSARLKKSDPLGAFAQVELVRALGDQLGAKEHLREVERLSSEADFSGAYRLSPVVLSLAPRSEKLQKIYRAWLSGSAPRAMTAAERAALSLRTLGLLVDASPSPAQGTSDLMRAVRAEVPALVEAENPRVRSMALSAWSQSTAASDIDPALRLLARDPWPFVRQDAARFLASRLNLAFDAEVSTALTRSMRRDRETGTRRAATRALASATDEKSLKALRKTFSRDEDYEVRAEAAIVLGERCDSESLAELSEKSQALLSPSATEGEIALGLAAVQALVMLNPRDLETRLAPLLSDSAPGLLKTRVRQTRETARQRTGQKSCAFPK